MKVSVYIATSLDGYIARADGDISWLREAGSSAGQEDYGYGEFFRSVDCMILGRKSFETVLSFPTWPYTGKRVIVLTKTLEEIPARVRGRVELYSGLMKELVASLEAEGCRRIYIDGGKIIRSFLRKNLLTDITITRIPLLLGEGIRLFGETGYDIKLRHIKTKSYESGFVKSTYEFALQ
ncbi:dihydrofolate reductase family protein [Desulfotalea psychrophila]|uniref:Similar to dihydrofolate reductase n=1 Tax=Desulfotalea psychrophila (strain LSv54 / DSM 12343) TaxID=177439 RepID=Q6AQD9_DESPS|nr:dihydrofolate reductase family protein [Desulfotalea psychrophila]CAG35434.1 similar to dihydrofolate reductase [Desulfotalea psychrophila LSv54]